MGSWPDPSDTQLDIARALLWYYRQALLESAPARCEALDRAATELGQGWVVPQQLVTEPGERVTTARAALIFGVVPATVRGWISDPKVPVRRYPDGVDVDEIRELLANRRRRRGHR